MVTSTARLITNSATDPDLRDSSNEGLKVFVISV